MLNQNIEDKLTDRFLERLENPIHDRIAGVIFGAACGGSLGGSCIGLSHKEILATVGISRLRDFEPGLSKSCLPDHKPGALLADTLMGLALAVSLVHSKGTLDSWDLKSRYGKLLEDPRFVNSAPGAPCLAALRDMIDGLKTGEELAQVTHPSGAARAFPAGCLPGGNRSGEPIKLAMEQAQLSSSEKVAAAAAVIADSISYFIQGGKIDTEVSVRNYVLRQYELAKKIDSSFAESWDGVAPDLDYRHPANELPYSLINVETDVSELVPTSVGIFLIFRHNAEEAICQAVRAGGDTDTVGTIVGALAGAYHGVSHLPRRWLDNISDKERLMAISNGLCGLWQNEAPAK